MNWCSRTSKSGLVLRAAIHKAWILETLNKATAALKDRDRRIPSNFSQTSVL